MRPKKKIHMFPPYRPGEIIFQFTRAHEKSTIPFFRLTVLFLFYFLCCSLASEIAIDIYRGKVIQNHHLRSTYVANSKFCPVMVEIRLGIWNSLVFKPQP